MNYQELSFNQFDLWKLCPQRYLLFLKFKLPCPLQLSIRSSVRSWRNYSDDFSLSYLYEHVVFRLTLHFLWYKTTSPFIQSRTTVVFGFTDVFVLHLYQVTTHFDTMVLPFIALRFWDSLLLIKFLTLQALGLQLVGCVRSYNFKIEWVIF